MFMIPIAILCTQGALCRIQNTSQGKFNNKENWEVETFSIDKSTPKSPSKTVVYRSNHVLNFVSNNQLAELRQITDIEKNPPDPHNTT